MNKFTFYHVTDVHVLCPDDSEDKAYRKQATERMAALDTVFDQIIADKEVDTVVISGDEAHHGRYTEHALFIAHARREDSEQHYRRRGMLADPSAVGGG